MKRSLLFMGPAMVLVAILMADPGLGAGQERTWVGHGLSQMVDGARWRAGSLRINAALALASIGYDTDIYFGFLGEAIPDYTASGSLPVQVLLPIGNKIVLDLTDTPQYAFFYLTERERAWNNVFRGQMYLSLKRVFIQAGAGFSTVRQRLSPELDINFREKKDSLNGTFLWQTSRKVSLALIGDGARYDYGEGHFGETDLGDVLNRSEGFLDLVMYVQPNSRVRLFLDGQYGHIAFKEIPSSQRDTRSYAGFAGLSFIPREGESRPVEPPQGRIILGYKRFELREDSLPDGTGLVGVVDISVGLFRRTVGRVSFVRDFAFSVYPGSAFFASTTFGGGLSRRLSRHATLSYDLIINRSHYPDVADSEGPIGQDFRYTTHSVALDIQLARHLALTLLSILSQRSVDDTTIKARRDFFGLNIVYGSPPRSFPTPERGLAR